MFAKRSSRFPGKHGAMIGEHTLIDTVILAVMAAEHIDSVIIFSKDPDVKSEYCDSVTDGSEGTIVESVLNAVSKYGTIFALAGDMPCISPEIIDSMVEMSGGNTVVPYHSDGMPEPLHSIYAASTLNKMEENLKAGSGRLRDLISSVMHVRFEIDEGHEENFYNVNYPEDLVRIREMGCGRIT